MIVRKLRLSGDFDFAAVAARTPGFVGADLQALTKEAAAVAVSRIFSSLQQSLLEPNLEGMQVEVEVCTWPPCRHSQLRTGIQELDVESRGVTTIQGMAGSVNAIKGLCLWWLSPAEAEAPACLQPSCRCIRT